jgi:hypothetical protein
MAPFRVSTPNHVNRTVPILVRVADTLYEVLELSEVCENFSSLLRDSLSETGEAIRDYPESIPDPRKEYIKPSLSSSDVLPGCFLWLNLHTINIISWRNHTIR